jgi:hypothetical protein
MLDLVYVKTAVFEGLNNESSDRYSLYVIFISTEISSPITSSRLHFNRYAILSINSKVPTVPGCGQLGDTGGVFYPN